MEHALSHRHPSVTGKTGAYLLVVFVSSTTSPLALDWYTHNSRTSDEARRSLRPSVTASWMISSARATEPKSGSDPGPGGGGAGNRLQIDEPETELNQSHDEQDDDRRRNGELEHRGTALGIASQPHPWGSIRMTFEAVQVTLSPMKPVR